VTRHKPTGQFVEDCWKMAALCIDLADFAPEAARLAAITNDVDGFGPGGGQRGPVGSVA
jgi:hypothetical protein